MKLIQTVASRKIPQSQAPATSMVRGGTESLHEE